ncbi:MAG: hypothetical protein ABL986_24355, partial [Vicinamibacterales bacterium]
MKAMALATLVLAATLDAQVIRFDAAPAGTLPDGWFSGMTHKGGPQKWQILADSSAPSKPSVLAQTSNDSTGGRFPFAVYDKASPKDGFVSVRFKAIAGKVDQAAGLIWRFRDADNYYMLQLGSDNTLTLWRKSAGTWSQIGDYTSPDLGLRPGSVINLQARVRDGAITPM